MTSPIRRGLSWYRNSGCRKNTRNDYDCRGSYEQVYVVDVKRVEIKDGG